MVSTNTPTIKDTGSSENNDIVISTVSYDASKHSSIESVFLSGDEISASLDGTVILHGNSGDNIITLSSSDDVIYSSSGLDYVNDSMQLIWTRSF